MNDLIDEIIKTKESIKIDILQKEKQLDELLEQLLEGEEE